VAHDFRQADIEAGGQGAPLVPVFHHAIVKTIERPHPVAVLNIGGVANVNFVDGGPDPIACDTGPGNALIDDFMRARTGAPYDDNGDVAATGRPDYNFIARVLDNPFFDLPPPKSLDRNDFAFCRSGLLEYSVPNGAATLSALTVEAVARIVLHLPLPPCAWVVAGGGECNRTLMKMLAEKLKPATVETADEAGFSADAAHARRAAGQALIKSSYCTEARDFLTTSPNRTISLCTKLSILASEPPSIGVSPNLLSEAWNDSEATIFSSSSCSFC
jgi:anhydro-N-acetylmuramic acid kinase